MENPFVRPSQEQRGVSGSTHEHARPAEADLLDSQVRHDARGANAVRCASTGDRTVAPWILRWLVRFICCTLRYRWCGLHWGSEARTARKALIYAFWHARFFPLIYTHRHRRIHVVVSHHKDGELVSRVIEGLGFGTVRGSTSRGGREALYGVLRVLRSGDDVAITPDGPRGPAEVAQIGALVAARLSGCSIVPVATACWPEIVLRSWDRYRIPVPFGRCVVAYGPPLPVPSGTDTAELEVLRHELGTRIRVVTERAERMARRSRGGWRSGTRAGRKRLSGSVARVWNAGAPSWLRFALLPLSQLWRCVMAMRRALFRTGVLPSITAGQYTVSVGNISVGGTGKTPLVMLLAQELRRRGVPTMVLSRGYGSPRGSRDVWTTNAGAARDAWEWVGDEAALVASKANVPVVSCRSRRRAVDEITRRRFSGVVLLDDGFQALSVRRDLDIVIVSASQPFGGRFVLPAGPLREGPEALARADLIAISGGCDDSCLEALRGRFAVPTVFVRRYLTGFRCWPSGTRVAPSRYRGAQVLAFAGLGDPRGFWHDLREAGLDLQGVVRFPDHYRYYPGDLHGLAGRAREAGSSVLVTTEKDAVRLARSGRPEVDVWVAEMGLTIEDQAWQVLLDGIYLRANQ